MKRAVFNSRRLSAIKSDLNDKKQKNSLLEWPSTLQIEKIQEPTELQLKTITFYKPSKTAQEKVGVYAVRAGASLETVAAKSHILKPEYL